MVEIANLVNVPRLVLTDKSSIVLETVSPILSLEMEYVTTIPMELVSIAKNIIVMEVIVLLALLVPLVPSSIAMEIVDLPETSVTTNVTMELSTITALYIQMILEIVSHALLDKFQIAMESVFFLPKLNNQETTEFATQDSTASNLVTMTTTVIHVFLDK